MLVQSSPRQSQPMPNGADGQGSTGHYAQRRIRQRVNPFRMHIFGKQRIDEIVGVFEFSFSIASGHRFLPPCDISGGRLLFLQSEFNLLLHITHGAAVTAEGYPVGAVVCVQAKDMKQPWCLATSLSDEKAGSLLKKYANRWSIECSFRDTKDPHFGMGMAQIRINSPERRDRLWLLNALAAALLTLLGAAGEALGFDKHLKASTTKRRTHSLFRQGCMHYQRIPTMQKSRLRPLMEKFGQLLREQPLFADIYGLI